MPSPPDLKASFALPSSVAGSAAAKTKPPGTAHSPGSQACSNTRRSDWSRRRVRGSRMMADPTRGGRDEQARSAASGTGESRPDARRLVAVAGRVDQEEQLIGRAEEVGVGAAARARTLRVA